MYANKSDNSEKLFEALFHLLELNTTYLNKYYPLEQTKQFTSSNNIQSQFPTEASLSTLVYNNLNSNEDYFPITNDTIRYTKSLLKDEYSRTELSILNQIDQKYVFENHFKIISDDFIDNFNYSLNSSTLNIFEKIHDLSVYPLTLSESDKLKYIELLYNNNKLAKYYFNQVSKNYSRYKKNLT